MARRKTKPAPLASPTMVDESWFSMHLGVDWSVVPRSKTDDDIARLSSQQFWGERSGRDGAVVRRFSKEAWIVKMFLVYDGQHKQRINADSAAIAAEIYANYSVCYDGDYCHEVVVTTQGDVGEGDGEVFEIQWTPKAVRR